MSGATALAGARVLDLSDPFGQYAGKLLANLGADVIKIEPPTGDPARRIGPFLDDLPGPERSLFWWYYNADKRSLALDLASDDGLDLFLRLAAQSEHRVVRRVAQRRKRPRNGRNRAEREPMSRRVVATERKYRTNQREERR